MNKIPNNIDECIDLLNSMITNEDKEYLIENGAISVHHTLGRWIRNNWKLWENEETDLKTALKKLGFNHPDDMSNYIIENFINYLKK